MIAIPERLVGAVQDDDLPARRAWLAGLPGQIEEIASAWSLELADPCLPGGQCAWVAPARDRVGRQLVLKVGWRHWEAEHEADALRLWDRDGVVGCLAARTLDDTAALLLERCVTGVPLNDVLPEPEQDIVLAGLLRRLWAHQPPAGHPFRPLSAMCDRWADSFEADFSSDSRGLDPAIARDSIAVLRELPRTADRAVLLCTDLHAENILAAEREPWLAIDPKPFLGDPAYDAIQHMLNCDERLAADPAGLAKTTGGAAGTEPRPSQAVAVRAVCAGVARRSDDARARPAAGTVKQLAPDGASRALDATAIVNLHLTDGRSS